MNPSPKKLKAKFQIGLAIGAAGLILTATWAGSTIKVNNVSATPAEVSTHHEQSAN